MPTLKLYLTSNIMGKKKKKKIETNIYLLLNVSFSWPIWCPHQKKFKKKGKFYLFY